MKTFINIIFRKYSKNIKGQFDDTLKVRTFYYFLFIN